MIFTLENVVNFIWKHKRKDFKDFTYEQIARHIIHAAAEARLVYVTDGENIIGICTLSEYPTRVYIHHIIAVGTGFASLIQEAKRRFPDKDIVGRRGDKTIIFRKDLLYGRLRRL